MGSAFAGSVRAAARALLPEGALLRRDRGEALFVSDAPRRGVYPDWATAGFTAVEENGLVRLTPDARWLTALAARYTAPPDFLCASLKRFDIAPVPEAIRLFSRGLKRLDGGADDPAFGRALRQLAARALRNHEPCGGLYACAILYHIIKEEREI